MKKQWLLLTCILVVLTMVLAACQGNTPEATTTAATITGTTSATTAPSTTAATTTTTPIKGADSGKTEEHISNIASVPKYGGTLTIGRTSDVVAFDPKFILAASTWTCHLTNERLTTGDWAKGPSGTGEEDWLLTDTWSLSTTVNLLCSDWEIPDTESFVIHVRQGIFWQNLAPANGRQMDAYDVAYSIERTYLHTDSINYPKKPEDRLTSVTATNQWTVVVKTPANTLGSAFRAVMTNMFVFPKELGDKGTVTKPTDAIGTGPFYISDYVRDSSLTLRKNPLYWRDDPVHPGNRLPYTDYIRALTIADNSTLISAVRTGKVDILRGVAWDDGKNLLSSNPDLQYIRYLQYTSTNIFYRMDKTELPYDDIKVRRALMMAIDRQGIINGYYGGNAENFTHPILPVKALSNMFTPLDQMPASVQENYQYNPEKAKQLLAEAGYPNGFNATIVCNQTHVDLLSVVVADWAKINVNLTLDIKETGTWTSIQRSRSQADMVCAPITNVYYSVPLAYLYDQSQYNRSWGKDDYIEKYYTEKMAPLRGPYDDVKLRAAVKELVPYLAELVWLIPLPTPYYYALWQPWVGGYHGELSVGTTSNENYPIYLWVDNDIKKK